MIYIYMYDIHVCLWLCVYVFVCVDEGIFQPPHTSYKNSKSCNFIIS